MIIFLGALFGMGQQMGMAAWQAAEAQKARDFQEKMYKHRYQYQVDDLRKAGLNVAMAYGQQPPGPPGGAQANLPKVDLMGQLSSAADAAAKKKSLEVMEKQASMLDMQTAEYSSQTALNQANADAVKLTSAASAAREYSQARLNDVNADVLTPKAKIYQQGSSFLDKAIESVRTGTVGQELRRAWKIGGDIVGRALYKSKDNPQPALEVRPRSK